MIIVFVCVCVWGILILCVCVCVFFFFWGGGGGGRVFNGFWGLQGVGFRVFRLWVCGLKFGFPGTEVFA